jgi:hypothetical protein
MATATTNIENNDTLISSLIPFVYGNAQVQVELNTLKKFRLIETMIEDLDSTVIPHIPIQIAKNGTPIYFSSEELQIFINLFELRHNILKTEGDLFQAINDLNISFDMIKKFMILINLLDNQTFLNSLCKYTAFMIHSDKVIL